jgi:hypothetical protein
MTSYTEPVKNKARRIVIDNAIAALTKDRTSSTLTRRSYVRDVKAHITNGKNPLDVKIASRLSNETIERWESFYDSIIQSRTPENLKVAYLSGPNPENDLRVLCEAGVLPENIWAFESENSTYSEAVVSALSSEFPFIKIVNGGLDALFRQVATPYQVNVEKTLRWSYKAKDTPMFMDMLILDECRYLYDWMPTVDMFSEAIRDTERQLAYRFALDGVAKHRRWYNPEYFSGTAVVDQFTDGFEAKALRPREIIEHDL